MVIWEREFKGQLFKDNLSFTTSPQMDGTFIFCGSFHFVLFFIVSDEPLPRKHTCDAH
jgi:hypothetical protein